MPQTDQGVFHDRYMVIPRCLIFVKKENKVLLIKGSPNKRLWANRYNGIGGHIERGEDIYEAARRELLEETGLIVDDLWLCGNIMVDASEKIGISIFIFCGEYRSGDLVTSEEGGLEWVDLSQLNSLPLVEDLYRILPLVTTMGKGDPPIIGRTFYDENDEMVVKIR